MISSYLPEEQQNVGSQWLTGENGTEEFTKKNEFERRIPPTNRCFFELNMQMKNKALLPRTKSIFYRLLNIQVLLYDLDIQKVYGSNVRGVRTSVIFVQHEVEHYKIWN